MERLPGMPGYFTRHLETARTLLQEEKSSASQPLSFVDPLSHRPLHNRMGILPQGCEARWICPEESFRQPFTKQFLHIRPSNVSSESSHYLGT